MEKQQYDARLTFSQLRQRQRLDQARASLEQAHRVLGLTVVSSSTRQGEGDLQGNRKSRFGDRREAPPRSTPVWHVDCDYSTLIDAIFNSAIDGRWVGVINVAHLGWCALAERGIDLARVVVIHAPREKAARIIATTLDGIDVVVCGVGLRGVEAQRMAARARLRHATILTTRPWHGVSRDWSIGSPLDTVGEQHRVSRAV